MDENLGASHASHIIPKKACPHNDTIKTFVFYLKIVNLITDWSRSIFLSSKIVTQGEISRIMIRYVKNPIQ